MAARTWLKLMRNSFVASAVFTAAQVGVGSGLAILDWPLGFTAIRGWGQLLTWVAFIFAAGVVGGAVLGGRTLRRTRPTLSTWNRVAAAVAAAAGSAAALPLVWIPVRVHLPVIDMRAETTMTVTAGIAVLAGLLLAMAALTWRSVGACMGATVAWVWLFALTSVALAAKDHVRVSPRLGVIDVPSGHPWWASPFVMVGLAAALGVVVGSVAGWKGSTWSGIALSGVSGPALLASAYLTTGWGVSGNSEDGRPYLAAMFALGAGLLASMAVASATIPHRPPPRPAKVSSVSDEAIPPAEQPRTAIAAMPAPLAITSYAEPAYVLEASPVEPAYRRQPAFATQSIYLPTPRPGSGDTPPPRPEPASRPDLYRHAEPASESSYEPPYEAPYEPPYDPAQPPRPSSYGATISAGGHAAKVEAAVVDSAVVDGVVVASTVVPGPVIEDALIVAPSSSDTTARSASGSAATTAAPTSTNGRRAAATLGKAAPASESGMSSGGSSSTSTPAPASASSAAGKSSVGASAGAPVAQPPPVSPVLATAADLQAAAAGSGDSTGASIGEGSRGNAKQEPPTSTDPSATTQSATTEPATTEPATTEPATTEPATTESVTTDAPADEPADNGKRKGRQKDKERRPAGRRSRRGENDSKSARGLRDNERDHIDWIDNLIKLPADPTLETRDR